MRVWSCRARNAIDPARVARAELQRKRPQRLRDRITHARFWLLDENRADIDAFARDHAAGRALQRARVAFFEHVRRNALPVLVRAAAALFGSDPEERKNLQTRSRESKTADEIQKSRSTFAAF